MMTSNMMSLYAELIFDFLKHLACAYQGRRPLIQRSAPQGRQAAHYAKRFLYPLLFDL
jgi:hypothetical protein